MEEMTPEEEFHLGQRQARARNRLKTRLAVTAYGLGALTFFGILVPLIILEEALIEAVPFLAAAGRLIFLLFAAVAALPAATMWAYTGGRQLLAIKKWEEERDKF
jgi:hypothetical protein